MPPPATLADALALAPLVPRLGLDLAALSFAIHGQRATPATPLREGDRVELLRPLLGRPEGCPAPRGRRKNPCRGRPAQGANAPVPCVDADNRRPPRLAASRRLGKNPSPCLCHGSSCAALAAFALAASLAVARARRSRRSPRWRARHARRSGLWWTRSGPARRTSRSTRSACIGVEYRYGGEVPESGLDCSGLVRHVFQQVTGVTLPRTSKEMSRLGDSIARQDLQPGDLVFFNTRRFAFSHVGIYLGDDRFIHAPRTGRDVEIAELGNRYWQKRFDGARRLVGVLPALVPSLVPTAEAAVACRAAARGSRGRAATLASSFAVDPPRGRRARPGTRRAGLLEARDEFLVLGLLRPRQRGGAVLVGDLDVRAALDQQDGRAEACLRAPPSSAPSCRWATSRRCVRPSASR